MLLHSYLLGCQITHIDTNWLPTASESTEVLVHNKETNESNSRSHVIAQGSFFSVSCTHSYCPCLGYTVTPKSMTPRAREEGNSSQKLEKTEIFTNKNKSWEATTVSSKEINYNWLYNWVWRQVLPLNRT